MVCRSDRRVSRPITVPARDAGNTFGLRYATFNLTGKQTPSTHRRVCYRRRTRYTATADRTSGASGYDMIKRRDGPDSLRGKLGNDTIYRDAEVNVIRGSSGNDIVGFFVSRMDRDGTTACND